MSPAVEETPNADGSIRNTVNKEEVVEHDFPPGSVPPEIIIHECCQKHYEQLLPFMAERAHDEKMKDVRSRLSCSESTEQETKNTSQRHDPRGSKKKKRKIVERWKEVQRSPSPSRSRSVFSRLGLEIRRRKKRQARSPSQASSRSGSVFSRLGAKKQEQRRRDTILCIKKQIKKQNS
ncbi:hypothetical protein Tco_0824916 [Tanacetum coccineum]